MDSEKTKIYVLVGKRVRFAEARFNRSGTVAIVDTAHGPIEFKSWHLTERAAKMAATKKANRSVAA